MSHDTKVITWPTLALTTTIFMHYMLNLISSAKVKIRLKAWAIQIRRDWREANDLLTKNLRAAQLNLLIWLCVLDPSVTWQSFPLVLSLIHSTTYEADWYGMFHVGHHMSFTVYILPSMDKNPFTETSLESIREKKREGAGQLTRVLQTRPIYQKSSQTLNLDMA